MFKNLVLLPWLITGLKFFLSFPFCWIMKLYFCALTLLPSHCVSFALFVTKDGTLQFVRWWFLFLHFCCCGVIMIQQPKVDQSLRGHLGHFASHTGLFFKNSCKHLYIEEWKNHAWTGKKSKKFKAFNTLAHLNLLYMHRFSWRMATVQMRLMLNRELIGRSECVCHHGLFIQPNISLLICLQRLCDHTFCHPMMHLPSFCLYVCPSNVYCAFTLSVTELPPLCVYIQCVNWERK